MARAVFSMSRSGRRLARTMATPTTASATTMIVLTSRSILASQAEGLVDVAEILAHDDDDALQDHDRPDRAVNLRLRSAW